MQQPLAATTRYCKTFCGGRDGVVPRPERSGERKKEKGKAGGRKGQGRSPLQYALEQDEMSTHRRKLRKEEKKGTGGKWGKSCCIVYPIIDDEDYEKKEGKELND